VIRHHVDTADNRRQLLFITPAGRALYAQYIPALRAREQAMLACLTPSEHKAFERLLDKLASHAPQWAAPGDL
jgi:DNA-binding MarR family transcriptional regulator